MSNSLDVDVDVDWLYKGKKKHKLQRKERSSSVSNGSLSHVMTKANGEPAKSGEQAVASEASAASTAAGASLAPSSSNEPLAASSGRSAATGASKSASSAAAKPPAAVSAKELKRSGSLNEKPKKSLLGSLFRRNSHGATDKPADKPGEKAGASGAAAATAAPTPVPVAPRTRLRSSSSAQQPMAMGITQVLKEPSSPEVKDTAPIHEERIVLNKNPRKQALPIESLAKLSLKRVTFAVDQFGMDPPQQIPSRKPRRGDVLVPDDMISRTPSISLGITNTQGSIEQGSSQFTPDSKEYKFALENHRRALRESDKHQQEAHYAAQRIAHEVQSFRAKTGAAGAAAANASGGANNPPASVPMAASTSTNEPDEKVKNLEIDKPIHMHENHFERDGVPTVDNVNEKLTLDKIYTRCCHLREILPIPSTLKQVRGKSAPLQTLKFLNPRPTLIDILSFCDFIAIVPIHNVIFDNVSLTPEMFKIVIASLVNSRIVEKIGFRNVVIDAEGWKLLCKFLMRNDSLLKIDISQTKIKPDLDVSLHRASMDWNLFIDVLQRRPGRPLEELLINGIKFENLDVFANLLTAFASASTSTRKRLGVAQSELSAEHLKFLMTWISEYKIQGVDMAFNDLGDLVKPMVSKFSSMDYSNLQYFTLNNTGIQTAYDAALILRALSKLPHLYFLDLSNLPQIFPDVFPYLNKYLPRFPMLKRLHLDSNEFSPRELAMVATILMKCKQLLHLSLLNIPKDAFTTGSCAGIYDCVTQSDKLTNLDINYNYMPEEISSRVALCLMRRMQRDFEFDEMTSQDDLLFDGSLLSETAENVLERLNNIDDLETDTTRRYLFKKYWEKFNRVHDNVQKTIDEMFEKRSTGELTLQSKENLLRLLFLENNLSKILEILKAHPLVAGVVGVDTSSQPANSEQLLVGNISDVDNATQVRPHLMATDSGRTIDVATGKPVLCKSSSHVSLVGKRQEEEEGEFHKWGFFVQQQRSIYPEHDFRHPSQGRGGSTGSDPLHVDVKLPPLRTKPPNPIVPPSQAFSSESHGPVNAQQTLPQADSPSQASSSAASSQPSVASPTSHTLIPKIPSGAELRDAVMRAKGINSIEDLIYNVNSNRVTLDKIYGLPLHPMSSASDEATIRSSPKAMALKSSISVSDTSSDEEDAEKVDETYDKLLNNLSKVRSNK